LTSFSPDSSFIILNSMTKSGFCTAVKPAITFVARFYSVARGVIVRMRPCRRATAHNVSSANPIGSFMSELDPMLRVQYPHKLNNSAGPLLDRNNDPLRIGPVFGFSVNPNGNADLSNWSRNAALTASVAFTSRFQLKLFCNGPSRLNPF
jgi:hypothetical protein